MIQLKLGGTYADNSLDWIKLCVRNVVELIDVSFRQYCDYGFWSYNGKWRVFKLYTAQLAL